ncbi:MAG: CAP domain-containing protein [Clostridiales bacterium]|nr:CAP domain-containing protein [Clostridiales bacterium]
MRKRVVAVILTLVLGILFMGQAVLANPFGGIAGDVLSTDIRVYLNGMAIEGFNINNETFVRAEDLPPFGFAAHWNEAARSISINKRPGLLPHELRQFSPDRRPIGSAVFPYFYTDITAYIDGQPALSFNIGGYTVVRISDIARAFGDSVWDNESRTVSVITAENRPFETALHMGNRFTNVFFAEATGLNAGNFAGATPVGNREIRWDLGATIHAYGRTQTHPIFPAMVVTHMLPGTRGGAFHDIEDGQLQTQRTLVHNRTFAPGEYLLLMNYTLEPDGRPASERQVSVPIHLVVELPALPLVLPEIAPDIAALHPNAPERASSNIAIPENRAMTDSELNNWIAEYASNGGASAFELEVVRLINELRVEMGLHSFEICPDLMMAARYKSQEMVNLGYFAHDSPIHGRFTGIPRLFGASATSENLGSGQRSPQGIVSSWLNSTTGHRSPIVGNRNFIGIGEYNNRWTLMVR